MRFCSIINYTYIGPCPNGCTTAAGCTSGNRQMIEITCCANMNILLVIGIALVFLIDFRTRTNRCFGSGIQNVDTDGAGKGISW
ncbi:hypothetical protein SDC9_184092 [bioreactor metagenome]|uniref:Uncharacterized protein n=1 Tax=bioreactor metagenome TaxID=1076179 RepID=A0A645HLT0_9ZZZZ